MKFKFGKKRLHNVVGFNAILPEILDEFQLKNSFTIEFIREQWPILVGDIISTHSLPDRIFKNTLFVTADHSIYAQEIMLMQDAIKRKLVAEYSVSFIAHIKTEVKKIKWNATQQGKSER